MKSLFVTRSAALRHRVALSILAPSLALTALPAMAAVLPNRLSADAQLTDRAELPQGVSRRVTTAQTLGHLAGDTQLSTMSLVLAPSAAQAADLDQLLAAQQDPTSPSYHQWLTPEQFGARFGISDGDLQTLENWLTSQGLQVLSVSPSRNSIEFSGTAANVESAFRTNLARFHRADQDFFENSTAPMVPKAFQGVVAGITGLSSFRMAGHAIKKTLSAQTTGIGPNYNSSSGAHYLTPYDIRQIYGGNGLYSSGYSGTGLSIGVIGQSAVDTAQLAYFQTLTGQTVKAPTLLLVPNTGTSTRYSGDEGESEADLEFAGGVAPGATLTFIYTGNSTTADVITAMEYAITNKTASILTLSYGACEISYATSATTTIEPYFKQANAQGQTILISSGDSGAAGCDDGTTAYDGLQVSYPATSPYVTAVGGTTFSEGAGSYWATSNNSQGGSALGYIPEVAWNETTSTSGLASTGGGASQLFSKPNWQTGTGVPADGARDIPDVSFSASSGHDAYILCTSDTSFTQTVSGKTVTGQCTATGYGAFVVGGTSLGTPSFAGLLALIETANSGKSLGNINPTLYSLRASTPAIFHDVTSGNNIVPCSVGTLNCPSGTLGYSATVGYDLVTGLGSLDAGQLSAAITAATTTSAKVPTVTLSNSSSTTTSLTFLIRVAASNTATVPTGTVSVAVDGGAATLVSLNSGVATYVLTTTGLSAGQHTIAAAYSGDTNFSAASTSTSVTISLANGTISLAASPGTLTVASGGSGTISLALTANAGFTGLVTYKVGLATGSATPSGCVTGQFDVGVPAGGTVTSTLVYHNSASDSACTGTTTRFSPAVQAAVDPVHGTGSGPAPWLAVTATFGLFGMCLRNRKPWMTGLLALAFSAGVLCVSGCGNGSTALSTSTTTTPTTTSGTKGTYALVITATSYPSGSLSATSNVTLVVQ